MTKLETITAEDLQNRTYEPTHFLVDELIPEGLHILAGAPKIGKSWLALWLCLCVSQGQPLWNFAVTQGEVLYLSLEDSYRRIQTRLFDLAGGPPLQAYFHREEYQTLTSLFVSGIVWIENEGGWTHMKKWVSLFLAVTMLFALSLPAFAADSEAQEAAQTLHKLGLFKGTGVDVSGKPVFDLNRAPTRAEAVTMLVRLLGKEAEALAGSWEIPFTDVADWAKPYVGYAYANGLTTGVSETSFGGNQAVTAAQFLTFVLRALGYESGKDFSWDSAWTLTDTLGMTSGQYNAKSNGSFLRADAALVSVFALSTAGKAGKTLYETIFSAKLPQTLADTIDRLAGRTPKRDTSRAKAGYGKYLDTLHLPDILGKPQYSQAEIRQMLDYSLDELRDAIYSEANL